jgi:hypothetical protein
MHGAHIPLALSHCHFNEHVQPPLHHMIAFELVLSHAAAAARLLTKNKQTGEFHLGGYRSRDLSDCRCALAAGADCPFCRYVYR